MSVLQKGPVPSGRQAYWLPMDSIVPRARPPRRQEDDPALLSLAASIRQHGLLQPILVRPMEAGYEIISGERRFRACELLGCTCIDAFILSASEAQGALLALAENLQREPLHFLEEAEACESLLSGGMPVETLARRLGKSLADIENQLELLALEPELRRYLTESGLSEGHARTLLPLPDAETRIDIARQAVELHLSPRETEALVRKALRHAPASPVRKVISLVRDYRLYVNAVKHIVRDMQNIGLETGLETTESDKWLDLRIRVRK